MPSLVSHIAHLWWVAIPGVILLVAAIIYWPRRQRSRTSAGRSRQRPTPQPAWVATSIDRLNANNPDAMPMPLPPGSVQFEHWCIQWYTPANGVAGYFLIGRVYGDPLIDDKLAVYVGPVTQVCGRILDVQGYWVVLGRPEIHYRDKVTNDQAPLSHITDGQITHYATLEQMAILTETRIPVDLMAAELMSSFTVE